MSVSRIDVLVVEDDRAVSDLVVHALHRVGLTTDVASEVVEAKRLLSRGVYKVLVLDLILPDGTGFDVLDFIKAEKVGPFEIVVITGADASLLTRIDRSMVKTVMFKPIAPDHFSELIRSLAL